VLLCRFWTHRGLHALSFHCSQLGLLGLRTVGPAVGVEAAGAVAQLAPEGDRRVPIGEDPPSWSLRRRDSFRSSAEGFLLCVATATTVRRVGVFPLCQYAVAARGVEFFIFQGSRCEGDLSRTTYNGGLLAVDPDVPEPLAIEALSHPALRFVGFNPDDDVTEVGQREYFGRLLIACERHQEEEDIMGLGATLSFWSGDRYLSHTDDTEAQCQKFI